ncbi:uncharacterized protein LOC111383152 [Olea europaea var. sylvestris]|uniref:uncharacterized protein LOC111383152 n=1 Tax=Olea europaea var. sylvestris TaxID=158386 RepID=UPI000C1CE3CA|nr:uncharacterized protein LOC111383152 [Olea europaea var. sylvestris]
MQESYWDGWFFSQKEHGGQLLTAVGIDGNNEMYPVAYEMVETEYGEIWSWEACEKWNEEIGPRIQKILSKNGDLARREYTDYSSNGKFQVRNNIGTLNAVNIKAKNLFLSSLVVDWDPLLPSDYILNLKENEGLDPLNPPLYTKKAKRRKKARRKEDSKGMGSSSNEKASSNASRMGLKIKCKKCGQIGHNKRTCNTLPQPNGTWGVV